MCKGLARLKHVLLFATEEDLLVKKELETPSKGSQDVLELSPISENVIESTPETRDKNLILGQSAKSHKITSVNKARNDSRMKKKPATHVTKPPQLSTSRASKLALTPTTSSASRTRSKTGTTLSYSSTKTKNSSVVQSKKIAWRLDYVV
ncbi:hypothetical protein HRI_004033500 [Hibiscus trionum]|uniref:Uncharacterized protein n=1 Tax=Hibiscus trionum TaxID=183268 RepID=A0A9W7IZD2_HIBTR|nr:hypothetical protein HRI_004033500 [Hibiscus trionum]